MTIEPPPERRIAGMQCFTDRNTPSRLIAVCRRQSASVISTMVGAPTPMPAFDTSTSRRLKRFSISATISIQRSLVGHVLAQIDRLAARTGDGLDDLGAAAIVDIGDDHLRALARQRRRACRADA